MRLICAIGATLLLTCAVPTTSRAEDLPAAASLASHQYLASCDAPVANPNAVRRHRPVRHYVRHYRRWRRPALVFVPRPPPPLIVYNPWLPGPYNTGYDRAMLLHYESPPVSGVRIDPGVPTTPPVAGLRPYRAQAGEAVVQYDGLTGEYIPLAQVDARRVLAAGPLPPVPPPPSRPFWDLF